MNDPINRMIGNVQGYELPRGCLMTTGLILLPILTFGIGILRAQTLGDVATATALAAVLTLACGAAQFAFFRPTRRREGS